MTDKITVLQQFFASIEKNDFGTVESLLHPSFYFMSDEKVVLNKQDYLLFLKALKGAFPDWAWGASKLKEEGPSVSCEMHNTGTNTGPWKAIPCLSYDSFDPTGRSLQRETEVAFMFKGSQLAFQADKPDKNLGINGIFVQLGKAEPLAEEEEDNDA